MITRETTVRETTVRVMNVRKDNKRATTRTERITATDHYEIRCPR